MSTTLKNTKANEGSAQPPSVKKDDAKPKNDDKGPNVPKKRDPLIVPEIPGQMKKLLNDKDRPVKGLECIVVKFYPNNFHEVSYVVTDDVGVESTYSVTEFMKLQDKTVQKRREEHELASLRGLPQKLYKRLLIIAPEEINIAEGRRILAIRPPTVAKRMLNFTQKDFVENFKTYESVVSFWENAPDTAVDAMNAYQKAILSKISWTDTCVSAREEITDQKAAKAQRELEKSQAKAALVKATSDQGGASKSEALVANGRNQKLFGSGVKTPEFNAPEIHSRWGDSDDDVRRNTFSVMPIIQTLDPALQKEVTADIFIDSDLWGQEHVDWFTAQIKILTEGGTPQWETKPPLTSVSGDEQHL